MHRADGVIFAQLMHTGRIGHPSLLPYGLAPVGPSPVAAKGHVYTHEGPKEFVTPVELGEAEIRQGVHRPPRARRPHRVSGAPPA